MFQLLEDLFSNFGITPTVEVATTGPADGFNSTPLPTFSNLYPSTAQPSLLNLPSPVPAQQQSFMSGMLTPQSAVQQGSMATGPTSPLAPPTFTSPFAGLDLLLGTGIPAKTTKDSFFPLTPANKSIQQLQMEKKVSEHN
jgi:hypothetical protein